MSVYLYIPTTHLFIYPPIDPHTTPLAIHICIDRHSLDSLVGYLGLTTNWSDLQQQFGFNCGSE